MCTEKSSSGRVWECKRCLEPINIHVPDEDRKFLIEGGDIFCGVTCKNAYKQHIPLRLNRDNKPVKRAKQKKKEEKKQKVIFKCFSCNKERDYLPFDKLCPSCYDKLASENKARQDRGEFITGLVGSLTNEQRSLIRLSKIN